MTGSKSAVVCETTGTAPALSSSGQNPLLGNGRQKFVHRQALRGQDAVHRLQRKLAPAAQKIGDVRLPKTRLPRQ
jgi:hypothetical protein